MKISIVSGLPLCLSAALLAAAPPPPEGTRETDSVCGRSARYVMPDNVELAKTQEPGVVPADLTGTSTRTTVPPEIAFPLFADPIGAYPQVSRRGDTSLYLGDVKFNWASGELKIGGERVSDPELPGCDSTP